MNKVVMLSDIRKEKKEIKLNKYRQENNNDISVNHNEEYSSFKNKFSKKCRILSDSSEDSMMNDYSYANKLNQDINRIFINSKKAFLDFINEIFDDCLGTNSFVEYADDSKSDEKIVDGILKDPSNNITVNINDEYRSFEYNIQLQTYDYENIAITISKTDLNSNCMNIINLDQKKKQYKINDEKGIDNNYSDLYMIMVNSNMRVPDSYEVIQECNGSTISYKFNIFKGWKYDFNDLYKRNLYMLFPLKVFDLKKCINYMEASSYPKEMIDKEIDRFFNEMNKYLNKVKDKNRINDDDIREMNLISRELISDLILSR